MTESSSRQTWDDDRLAAAFSARDGARPASTTLVPATLERIAVERRPMRVRWIGGLRSAWALLAVAAVVAVIGSLSIPLATQRPTTSLPAVTATHPPVVTAAPSAFVPSEGPDTALGLPIISVKDAIAVRDAGVDDRELAVRGWYTPMSVAIFGCPLFRRQVLPVQPGCGDQFVWLTQEDEPTGRVSKGSTEFFPPKGPAIHPSFDELGGMWPTFALRLCGPSCAPHPTSIVAIGHFDDRRASLCDASLRQQCQDRFVVDRVDKVDGRTLDLNVADTRGADRIWTLEDVARLDPLAPPDGRLSVQIVNGRDKSLGIEPNLASDPTWSEEPAVWIIRDLIAGQLVTRVIADGSRRVFEFNHDGTISAADATQPPPRDATWPPLGSIVVAQSSGGANRPLVAIRDDTGHMVRAGRTTGMEAPTHDLSGGSLWVDPLGKRRLIVQWGGSACDRDLVLRITNHFNLILGGKRDATCRAALVEWSVELRFDRDVELASLENRIMTTVTIVD